MITIIILNWNGKQDTLACLTSLQESDYKDHRIVLVDNGSHDDSVACIQKEFPHVEIIETKTNLGFAGGNNVALRQVLKTNTDYILLLNNDTVVKPEMLTAFVKRAEEQPDSAWGAKLYLYDLPDTFDHFGGNWDPKSGFFRLIANRQRDDGNAYPDPIEMDYICGAALFAPKRIFEKVGLLEERYFLIWEEADWCMRAKKLGYKMQLCPEAKLFHKVSASFVGGKPHQSYFNCRNRLLFIERNFSGKERCRYLFRILAIEMTRTYKHWQMRCIARRLGLILRKDKPGRKEKIQNYRAKLCGVRDYVFRRFGNCPKWVYK